LVGWKGAYDNLLNKYNYVVSLYLNSVQKINEIAEGNEDMGSVESDDHNDPIGSTENLDSNKQNKNIRKQALLLFMTLASLVIVSLNALKINISVDSLTGKDKLKAEVELLKATNNKLQNQFGEASKAQVELNVRSIECQLRYATLSTERSIVSGCVMEGIYFAIVLVLLVLVSNCLKTSPEQSVHTQDAFGVKTIEIISECKTVEINQSNSNLQLYQYEASSFDPVDPQTQIRKLNEE